MAYVGYQWTFGPREEQKKDAGPAEIKAVRR
jgi:hypothetical protein